MIREAIDKIITDVEELYWSNATLAAFTQSESSLIEAAMRTCRLYNSAKYAGA